MNKKNKNILIIIAVIVLLYAIYLYYKYKTSGAIVNIVTGEPIAISVPKTDTSGTVTGSNVLTNFQLIQKNVSATADVNNIVKKIFDTKGNFVQIYSNGRFFVYTKDLKFICKGSYREGGKVLVIDGSNTTIQGTNVLSNFTSCLPPVSLTAVNTYT